MSHFSKIKTKLYDRNILKKSLSDLKLEWTEQNQQIVGYQKQTHDAEIIVKQSNNYDIGFKWNGVEYELVTDLMFWAQPYSVDKFLNQINQRYAYNSIVQVSERENFNFTQSENSQDGSIRVLLTRYK
mgnify:FL=1|jgi:hypothetical protein|uniref:Uncharacterized protein ycf35 n=1 Tax=Emiliania huxleyi TaxID=2903 RepID=Q4G3D4_EMIHU|nr:hypothetical chloroplast RF35 [Gephyrocapsa oceanica]YP_010393496.1 hypothetical chloroplast RF35 [Gephyrocapsa muellerae]YP_010393606.1 hypothetical chloroplast RF35 [Gephyrocapsa ericsonii]YP_010393716.1 hypothetical chloroplast RF35 [Gephyrocapsa parvula]YP_277333.1 Ycf35 [Emiliania huxleyi]AAX13832.1 hypothetical chloroplast RF35 [Emiliania huxleyi]AEI29495.1 hypothetical chloroplast RF35 [Emiliania huxleyi]UPY81602.1 hypothetical chloroplast RF35 [Emiliania huxleyi]UPY82395.1 hypoth|mmetsp:Transcript_31385/g.95527  ORF Transcript_31385/g.95527 Transcript_31385/m.95527 type:complete len:128 (-) Transcript_31385:58-441(-)